VVTQNTGGNLTPAALGGQLQINRNDTIGTGTSLAFALLLRAGPRFQMVRHAGAAGTGSGSASGALVPPRFQMARRAGAGVAVLVGVLATVSSCKLAKPEPPPPPPFDKKGVSGIVFES
jgi:hypothetical protein